MSTELEKSMESSIVVFRRYATEEGGVYRLKKKDFKKLVETELPNFLKAQKDPKLVDKLMKDLDQNKDDQLDFEEYLSLSNGLCLVCEKGYKSECKK